MEAACLWASFHPVAFRDSAVPPGAIVSFPGCQKHTGLYLSPGAVLLRRYVSTISHRNLSPPAKLGYYQFVRVCVPHVRLKGNNRRRVCVILSNINSHEVIYYSCYFSIEGHNDNITE